MADHNIHGGAAHDSHDSHAAPANLRRSASSLINRMHASANASGLSPINMFSPGANWLDANANFVLQPQQ